MSLIALVLAIKWVMKHVLSFSFPLLSFGRGRNSPDAPAERLNIDIHSIRVQQTINLSVCRKPLSTWQITHSETPVDIDMAPETPFVQPQLFLMRSPLNQPNQQSRRRQAIGAETSQRDATATRRARLRNPNRTMNTLSLILNPFSLRQSSRLLWSNALAAQPPPPLRRMISLNPTLKKSP